jgi:hypothetical protein
MSAGRRGDFSFAPCECALVKNVCYRLLLSACLAAASVRSACAFDLTFSINNQASFTANQLTIVNNALVQVEGMWETVLTGYQPGISLSPVFISVNPTTSGLASASFSGTTNQGGFTLATGGFININTLEIENFANWQGDEPNGLNFIDELMAHEVGHVLGIGTLWDDNGHYAGNFQYTGAHGLAAYRAEFDASATFVPVENAGSAGTPHAHWDQKMRSGGEAGDPSNPFLLDPRVGVTDQYGRDRALEVMTGAIDPDFLEPFLSRTTVESMRDMGYTVAKFEDFNGDGLVNSADLAILQANMGATGLQIDSIRFGDADRDRDVDLRDYALWAAAAPEPGSLALAALAMFAAAGVRRSIKHGPA